MCDSNRDAKQLAFLYDWMRLARKPNQTLHQDIKLIFELIAIPITESELKIIERQINPEGNKVELSKADLLACFAVEQENRKVKQKDLVKAFKYISGQQDDISFEQLRNHFHAQEVDAVTTELILKQLCEYENEQGKFDYKRFANSIY